MSKNVLIFYALIGVSLAIQCYTDQLSGKGKSHTLEKRTEECGDKCNFCIKSVGKVGTAPVINWDCGCDGDRAFVCYKKGKDKAVIQDSQTGKDVKWTKYCCEGNLCNSVNEIKLFFALFLIVISIFRVF